MGNPCPSLPVSDYIAMCNRIGKENDLCFAGESLVAAPEGYLLYKTEKEDILCLVDVPLNRVASCRAAKNWLQFD